MPPKNAVRAGPMARLARYTLEACAPAGVSAATVSLADVKSPAWSGLSAASRTRLSQGLPDALSRAWIFAMTDASSAALATGRRLTAISAAGPPETLPYAESVVNRPDGVPAIMGGI